MTPHLSATSVSKSYPVARSGLARVFDRRRATVLDGIDLSVPHGEVIGIVGESGSGKTTLARLLIGLDRPSAGTVRFEGQDLATMDAAARKALHRDVQMVFQGTQASLNPRKTVRRALAEASPPGERSAEALTALLDQVRLPAGLLERLPHELSGGQRQRIGIARALARAPKAIIADEPTSALDVSVQRDVVALLARLQRERGITLLVISHDLGLVASLCREVVVMAGGRIVERGPALDVLTVPQDAYTRRLVAAVPRGLAGRRARKGASEAASEAGGQV